MKTTRKILICVVALIVALTVATTTTYAWFNLNKTVAVDEFELKMLSNTDTLYIAVGDVTGGVKMSNYAYAATELDIYEAIYASATGTAYTYEAGVNTAAAKLAAIKNAVNEVVVMDAVTYDSTDNRFETENGTAIAGLGAATTSAPVKYISFNVYFRSLTQAYKVGLSGDEVAGAVSSRVTSDGVSTLTAWDNSITAGAYGTATAQGAALSAAAANAARVMFTSAYTTVTENDTVIAKTWNPNYNKGYFKGNLAADYRLYLNNGDETATHAAPKMNETAGITLDVTGTETFTQGSTIAVLQSNETTGYFENYVTVTIYVEGCDGDCFDQILKDNIKVALSFVGRTSASVVA